MRNILKLFLKTFSIFFAVILLIICFGLIRGQILVLRTYTIPSKTTEKIRIVGLADLHGDAQGNKQKKIVQKVKSANPDLIVYLGDMIDKTKPTESADLLVELTEQLIEIAPVFYVDGNHELNVRDTASNIYKQLNDRLKKAGAISVNDDIVQYNIISNTISYISVESKNAIEENNTDEDVINLCGITTHYFWDDKDYSIVNSLHEMNGINILLCHYPESVLWYKPFEGGRLNVALCGHTHGGLIRIPFAGGFFAPEQGKWPLYDYGAYPVYNDTTSTDYGGKEESIYLGTMIISAGLSGEHGIPRFNNPEEISIIEVGYNN